MQNIMVFRFANGIFEPIWNRRYIDHVQITTPRRSGVEQRGGIFRQCRDSARHGSESHDAVDQPDGDGASGRLKPMPFAMKRRKCCARCSR